MPLDNWQRDLKDFFHRHWHRWHFVRALEWKAIETYLQPQPGERIADLACGLGYYTAVLSRKGCWVVGLDMHRGAMATAQRIFASQRSHFTVANAEHLPFPTAAFDKVVAVCALEHFTADVVALAEMQRILRPGGRVVLSVDSFTWPGLGAKFLQTHRRRYAVVRYYTPEDLRQKLSEVGFQWEAGQYVLNSAVSVGLTRLSFALRFPTYLLLYPLAYPLARWADRRWGRTDAGLIYVACAQAQS
ncbi:MAG TPA: class I SAM-dependent methyltransferase [Armatimonadetes bacterium]|nr:class I SAM-dependent methyltransferase [Armatimonadota bacterium]